MLVILLNPKYHVKKIAVSQLKCCQPYAAQRQSPIAVSQSITSVEVKVFPLCVVDRLFSGVDSYCWYGWNIAVRMHGKLILGLHTNFK